VQDRSTDRSSRDDRDISTELKRWRTCALSDLERGKRLRTFETSVLSDRERAHIQTALERCSSPMEIKEVFRAAQEGQLV
jgi:hypothetical protein